MRLNLLAKHYVEFFRQAQTTTVKPEEIIEKTIFRSPFLTAQSIFDDILPAINSDKFYALSLVGPQGKGKTTLASIFATIAEDCGFMIVYAKAEDILADLPSWIEKVKSKIESYQQERICFILDDMSYTSDGISKKQSAIFKHFVADIRHVFEEVLGSVKIFMIYNSHRLHSLPPMLRNSGSWIFSSMQAADREDMVKLIARRKEMREKLDAIYTFIAQVSIDGPKFGTLKFNFGNNETEFTWGSKENPGDGRLMVSYHAGDIKIFNSQVLKNMIDIESPLYRIKYVPPPPITEEEIQIKKIQEQKEFENKAKKISEELNKHTKPEILPEITSLVPLKEYDK